MHFVWGVIIALFVLVLVSHYEGFTISNTNPIRSILDGNLHNVHARHKNQQEAADLMAKVHLKGIELMRRLSLYTDGSPRSIVAQNLLSRYSVDNLFENSPLNPLNDTAFTIRKGKILALCLRNKKLNTLHDEELITFVHFHELSHIAIDDLQHPPKFWSVFKFLLSEARIAGILNAPDYSRYPVMYCGLKVDYNPLYDNSLPIYA
jgi:hypothetical protein